MTRSTFYDTFTDTSYSVDEYGYGTDEVISFLKFTDRDERIANFARIDAENPGLMKFLKCAAHPDVDSELGSNLFRNLAFFGHLTEKQIAAANAMMEKCNA